MESRVEKNKNLISKFEEIQKANESLMGIDVKGKEYIEVNQRIKAFRMLYPEGFIRTEIVSNENGICVMRAEVGYYETERFDEYGNVNEYILGTGTAYEKEGSTFINKTSYIENCETSAVGRALAMCGIGIDTSIASAEEVQNAIAQKNDQLDNKVKFDQLLMETDTDRESVYEHYGVESYDKLTHTQVLDALKNLEAKKKKSKYN